MQKVLQCCFILIALMGFGSVVNGNEALTITQRMQLTFPAIAAQEQVNLSVILNQTWFETLKSTPERLTALGLTAQLPLTPSQASITLLNTSTISQLEATHPIITNVPILKGKNYNYQILNYLITVLNLDTSNTTKKVLASLPFGRSLVASLLNTIDATLETRRYLTEVYPSLKSAVPSIITATASSYYAPFTMSLSLSEFKELIGMDKFSELESIRSAMLLSVVEQDATAVASNSKRLASLFSATFKGKIWNLQQVMNRTLNESVVKCGIDTNNKSSSTVEEILLTCINISTSFPIKKIWKDMRIVERKSLGDISTLLNVSLNHLTKLSVFSILGMLRSSYLRSSEILKSPLMYVAFQKHIAESRVKEMTLLGFGPAVTSVTSQNLYTDMNSTQLQKLNVRIKDLPDFYARNLGVNLTLNAVYTVSHTDHVKSVMSGNGSYLSNALVKGLVSIVSKVSVGNIGKTYNISQARLDRLTLVELANLVSGKNKTEVKDIFKWTTQNLELLSKASIFDSIILSKLTGSKRSADDITPAALTNQLFGLDSKTLRLLDSVQVVSNAMNTTMDNLTLSNLKYYGPWNENDVANLFKTFPIPMTYFNATRETKISNLIKDFDAFVNRTENTTIIQLVSALRSRPSEFGGVYLRKFSTFDEVAVLDKKQLDDLLTLSWFQIMGSTPERLRHLGFMAKLPSEPSNGLINLLNTSSIANLGKTHQVLTNVPELAGKNYSYPVIKYLENAIAIDGINMTRKVIKDLPIGHASIAAILNTTDAILESRRYLTDVYPQLKSSEKSIMTKSAPSYYANVLSRKFSSGQLEQFVGQNKYSELENLRSEMFRNAIELDAPSAKSNGARFATVLDSALKKQVMELRKFMLSPLNASIENCSVNSARLLSYTLKSVLLQCINVTTDLPVYNYIQNPMFKERRSIDEMAKFLKLPASSLRPLSASNILVMMMLAYQKNLTTLKSPLGYASSMKGMSLYEVKDTTLLNIGPTVSMVPSEYIYTGKNSSQLEQLNITIKDLPNYFKRNMNINVTFNTILTISHSDLVESVMSNNASYFEDAITKGLVFTANKVSLADIRRAYHISKPRFNDMTLVGLAYHISGRNETEFSTIFLPTGPALNIMRKASMFEADVLLKLVGQNKSLDEFTPVGLGNQLSFLVQHPLNLRLFDTVKNVAATKKTSVGRLTPMDVKKYGPWSDMDTYRVLGVLKVPMVYFKSIQLMTLSNLTMDLNASVQSLENLSIIRLLSLLPNNTSEIGQIYTKMFMKFPDVAVADRVNFSQLLDNTWFGIVGSTSERMRYLGLTSRLSRMPSSGLINLLNTSSISKLSKTHPVLTNVPELAGKNYNYSVLKFFETAMAIDGVNMTRKAIKPLPIGYASIARILNTTDAMLESRRYLTDVYPQLKSSEKSIMKKSAPSYYANVLSRKFSSGQLEQFVGQNKYSELEKLRSEMFKNVIEFDAPSAKSNGARFAKVLDSALKKQVMELRKFMLSPLNALVENCSVNSAKLPSYTLKSVLLECVNVTTDLPVYNYIQNPMFKESRSIDEMAKFLKLPTSSLRPLSASKILEMTMLAYQKNLTTLQSPLGYASFMKNMGLYEVKNMTLLDFGPTVSMVPSEYIYTGKNSSQLEQLNITIKDLPNYLRRNLKVNVTLNITFTISHSDLVESILSNNDTHLQNAITKGLVFVSNKIPIGQISKVYHKPRNNLNKLTLPELAKEISGRNEAEFVKIFSISNSLRRIMTKASIYDAFVLLKLAGSAKVFDELTPVALSNQMALLVFAPPTVLRLLDKLKVIADTKKIASGNVTPLQLKQYGPWNDNDVAKLLGIMKISKVYIDSVQMLKISDLISNFNSSIKIIEKFNIISILAALNNKPSEVARIYMRMVITFPEVAALDKITLGELLNKTWFQIVGSTPERMRQLGFVAKLPSAPSNALLNLLNTERITTLGQTHKLITNVPELIGKGFKYSVLKFLYTALAIDTSNVTSKTIKSLPVGNASLAIFLNTTDVALGSRRYLTDVYPELKRKLQDVIQRSAPSYYNSLPAQTLTFQEFHQYVGYTDFKRLERLRSSYFNAVIDFDAKSATHHATLLGSSIINIVKARTQRLTTVYTESLSYTYGSCGFSSANISSFSIAEVMLKCINITKKFNFIKIFKITPTSLLNGITVGEIAAFLKMPFQKFERYKMVTIVQMSAESAHNMASPTIYLAYLKNISMHSLAEMTLGEIGSKINIVPHPDYLRNRTIMQMLNVTVKAIPSILRRRLRMNLTLSSLYTTPYAYFIKSYIFGTDGSVLKAGIAKGWVTISLTFPVSLVKRVYKLDEQYVEKQTLMSLAVGISGIGDDFAKLFNMTGIQVKRLGKAQFDDLRVLLKLNQSPKTFDELTNFQLGVFLTLLPPVTSLLLEKVRDVAKAKKIELQKLTLSDVQKFGSWNDTNVNSLLAILNVPRSFFDEMKLMRMSLLSRVLHTSVSHIGGLNIIKLNAALCSNKMRYNGAQCVAFNGCSAASSASICNANANCVDMLGSYVCRCNTGFTGNGTVCQDACSSKNCPSGSKCFNVPDKDPVCRCTKPLHVLKNNKCQDLRSDLKAKIKIIKISGMRFNQPFNSKYSDKTSKEFKDKSAALQDALIISVCNKLQGCVDIQIISITNGSIVVDYNVITDTQTHDVTASDVYNASVQALNDPALALFKPDKTNLPRARTSDICESGGHDCYQNSKCNVDDRGGYTCDCVSGYIKKGDSCAKDEKENIARIVVPIVVVIVFIVALVVFIVAFKRMRKRDSSRLKEADVYFGDRKTSTMELGTRNEKYSIHE